MPLAEPEDDLMDAPAQTENPEIDDGENALDREPPSMDEPEAAEGAGAITGKYNSSPVGDIQLSKKKNTYNTYALTLSMGQLEVILSALEKNHDDPVSDELLATFQYYIDKLPGPGEEEEEAEARNNPQAGADEESETPIPMPPGKKAPGAPKDLENMPEPEMPPGKARMLRQAGGRPGLPGSDIDNKNAANEELPPPPAE